MSLFKKFKVKSKWDKAKVDKAADKKRKPEAGETGTVLRQPDHPTPITKEKERAERTALEIAEQKDWEVKTLPVWQSGDVILDTYEVEDVISGGMGHVYIANHNKWNVKLAIKSPNEMMLSQKDFFARILREANSWTELGLHPNIAYCYYVRNIEDVPHIFVEYVDGGNLRQWIEEGKCIDYRTTLDLAIQFCHGMEHAHSKGMIHRDIKPENILMTQEGILKITDFGLVRGEVTGSESLDFDGVGTQQVQSADLTTVGTLMGTAGYMAPEQAESARDVDERADIFSFGVCLYEMFCGNRPYEITYGSVQQPPDPVSLSSDENFPQDIGAVLTKSVQWEPTERYKNFGEIRETLLDIYRDLFEKESLYAEQELIDLETDGLNNQGVSYFDLGKKEEAISCWEKALEINQMHPESTYNLSLILWREGKITDDEVLRRLDNCRNNPVIDQEKIAELKSFIHAERLDFDAARNVLNGFPGRYDAFFSKIDIDELGFIRTLEGHTDWVSSVALSPDGLYAVSGGRDKTLRVWELETGRCVNTLKGHKGFVTSVAVTPDGRHAVSGSEDKCLKVWKLATGKCIRTIKGHTDKVRSVALTPDGRYVISGSEYKDKSLRVWKLPRGRCMHSLEGHLGCVRSAAVTPDGRHVVSGSEDKSLRVWELSSGRCVNTLEGHTDSVSSLALSPDGRGAVSSSWDKNLRVWELASGRCVRTLEGHSGQVFSVALTPDGRHAVSSSGDGTLRMWELASGRCIRALEGHASGVHAVAITPDGRHAVSGSYSGTIRVWKIIADTPYLADFRVAFPKGFKAREEEKDALDQAISQAEELYEKEHYSNSFTLLYEAWKDIEFSDNEFINRLYSSLMEKGRKKGLKFSFQKGLLIGHTNEVTSVALSHEGRYAVSGSEDKTLRVWELDSGQCVRTMEGHAKGVSSLAISSNDQQAVSGSYDGTLRVWELASGQCVRTLAGHASGVTSVAISPDGHHAVSGSGDKTLRLWELSSGRCVRTLVGHTFYVLSATFTPDGRYVVSGSWDRDMRVWELKSGRCVHILEGHSGHITSVTLTPDGLHAVSASNDKTLRVWELKSGQCVYTLEGHTEEIQTVALSPDGWHAVSGSNDKTLKVWELVNGDCIRTIEGHTGPVKSLAVTPDGQQVVSASSDRTLRVWELIWDLEFP